MKKLIPVVLATVLAACNGPTDIKLSEVQQPENQKKLLEVLSPEDRNALNTYVLNHTMKGDLDYKTTVKEAIKIGKTEKSPFGIK
ncbi:MAG: hypothetical protein FWD62_02865 [Betaproteobacteria bacterium]|nr:hypothetical protein [Betaproteobacteria bacterium]